MHKLTGLVLLMMVPFLALAQPEFEGVEIAGGIDGAVSIYADDVDGDGDMDLMGSAENADQFLYWEQTPDGWVQTILASGVNGAGDLTTGDLDGDGDLDMVGTAYADNMRWFEQLADGTFAEHVIEEYGDCKTVLPYDMDDDGDLDLVVSANIMEEVVWIENQGNDDWLVHVLDTGTDGVWGMVIDDFDQDGDIDIATLARTDDTLTWYENGTDGWVEHLIAGSYDYGHGMDKGDIDGDGDIDLVTSSRNEDNIAWWENTLPGDWVRHDVTNNFDGSDDVHACDLDNDGDIDIIGAGAYQDEVAWFEQTGDGWTQHTIDAALDYVSAVFAADVDGDGDLDVLAAAYYADNFMLYDQLGTPGPVSLTLTPGTTTIPETGGTLNYTVDLVSTLPNSVQGVSYWTMVTLPSGQEYGPLVTIPFTLQAGMDVSVPSSQNIPALAPPGMYTFTGYVGFMGNPDYQINDGFMFEKLGAGPAGYAFNPAEWQAGDVDFTAGDDTDVVSVPSTFTLSDAYPNPFNSTTQLQVTLPVDATLQVVVYNVQGQRVVDLADGHHAAGTHRFAFDASHLSAGIYFVQAEVPGQWQQVRKVTFVK